MGGSLPVIFQRATAIQFPNIGNIYPQITQMNADGFQTSEIFPAENAEGIKGFQPF
jgi:hypothetical protein